MNFIDGIVNIANKLMNKRNATATNVITHEKVDYAQLDAIALSAIGVKIRSLKVNSALDDTIQFDTDTQRDFYLNNLANAVKRAAGRMMDHGRAIILINEMGDTIHADEMKRPPKTFKLDIFDGRDVMPQDICCDLNSPNYRKPNYYSVNGHLFHHSRVVDFIYIRPPSDLEGEYNYGGIPEWEILFPQIIADEVIQRACPRIIEINSTLYHQVAGFRNAVQAGQDDNLVKYHTAVASIRGIWGDGIVDAEDTITAVTQNLSNLSDVDQITIRRLAMASGIPITELMGEAASGLNATGKTEANMKLKMISNFQHEFLIDPINELLTKLGQPAIEFKDNQNDDPKAKADTEKVIIDGAMVLYTMGEDANAYLAEHDIVEARTPESDFPEVEDLDDETTANSEQTDSNQDEATAQA